MLHQTFQSKQTEKILLYMNLYIKENWKWTHLQMEISVSKILDVR